MIDLNLRNPAVLEKLRLNQIVISCPKEDPLFLSDRPNSAMEIATDGEWEVMVPDLVGIFSPEWGDDLAQLPHYRVVRISALTDKFGRFVVVRDLRPRLPFFTIDKAIIAKVVSGALNAEGLTRALLMKGSVDDT